MEDKSGVYIGYDGNGLFKIGWTSNYENRQRQIENMNPNFKYFCLIPCSNPTELERTLHERFRSKRMVGEWFDLTDEDIQAIVYEFNGIDVPIEDVRMSWEYAKGADRWGGGYDNEWI